MSKGWVKTHRSKLQWEWFTEYKTSHFFEYCILKASHKDTSYKGKKITRGSFWFGRKKASLECGLSESSIRTALNHLKSTNEIAIKTSSQGSIITVLNWDKYQVTSDDVTNGRPAVDQRLTTYKNVKNVKNVNKYSKELISLFTDQEIITWLQETGSEKIQDELYKIYTHSFIKEEIENAYHWQLENKKRKAGLYLKTWLNNSNRTDKYNKKEIERRLVLDNPDIFPSQE